MRILIVEDESKTAAYLKQGLSESGYAIDIASNGIDGLHKALEEEFDLIVLDVMLPLLDGWGVLDGLRRSKQTPVLMLTARSRIDDRVRGLESGADDYLPKPFAFPELLARIKVLLKRNNKVSPIETLQLAGLELDPVKHKAYRNQHQIDLTAREFALLHLLMRRHGEVLTRTLIASNVWDVNFDTDTNIVDVAIRRLRGKVDDGFSPKLIHTVRGVGYVFEVRNEE
ncbi:heavy metal response regulator transcription factor [Iodobacter fluviatilis]|uniref:Transcriptional activator protein CopR n=1 Tax=Iodobacter fluviatilis TaxID=537 RepID=A0A377QAJ4_9NEIS|nr:heavy metal response regulator transcription factor [Iodobacter fluviatilis]TCU81413.1 two-component system copper resistance phosphate regulon response regulator CusR [Iodobacter fluviatilis]STQ91943.1 Transcriptional activator protein CopR [Iodobacter fluviatilis]